MAFDTQITDLVGGTIDQTACDQWMEDGVRELINVFPDDLKEMCYTKNTFTSAAAGSEAETIASNHLGNIFAGSYVCRKIDGADKYKASDSGNVLYATATDPAYYVEGGKLNILPASSSGVYYLIPDPSIDVSAVSAISNFPNEAEYLVVLYAAIKQLQQYMNSKSSDLPFDLTPPVLESVSESLPTWSAPSDFSSPTIPVVPAISAIAYTDASNSDASVTAVTSATATAPSIVDVSSNAPTYTKPTLVLKVAPTISDLSISAVVPAVPSLSAQTLSAGGVFGASTAPTYSKPTITTRVAFSGYTSGLSETDPGVLTVTATAPTVPTLTTITFGSLDTDLDAGLPTYSTATISAGGVYGGNTAPEYTKPAFTSSSVFLTEMEAGTIGHADSDIDAEHWFSIVGQLIEDNEDVELAQAQLQKISTFVNAYQVDIQNELNQFNKENVVFQANIQEAMQELQVANQVNLAKAQGELQKNISNEDRSQKRAFQNSINDMKVIYDSNAQSIQKYQSELSVYQANVSKEVQQYGQKLQHYSTELNTAYQAWAKTESDSLSQYSTDIQNELNEFNKENTSFQANIQEAVQEVQLADANEARKLQKYQAEVTKYSADVNKQVQEYQQNLAGDIQVWQAERSTDLQKYGSDIQNELNEFNKENTRYQMEYQEASNKANQDLQIAVANANNLAQEYRQEAQQSTQLDQFNKQQDQALNLANAAKVMEKLVQDNNSKLQKYQAEVGVYSAELNANVQTFTQALTKNKAAFDTSMQKYTSDVQKVSSSNASTLQKFQAETADFSARLQKQTTDYTWYQGQYAQLKADYAAGITVLKGTQQGE